MVEEQLHEAEVEEYMMVGGGRGGGGRGGGRGGD